MTKTELESKPLSELHSLAAEAGVERYRMLSRGELVEKLAGAGDGASSGSSAGSGSERGERPARRRRRSGPKGDGEGGGADRGSSSGREPRGGRGSSGGREPRGGGDASGGRESGGGRERSGGRESGGRESSGGRDRSRQRESSSRGREQRPPRERQREAKPEPAEEQTQTPEPAAPVPATDSTARPKRRRRRRFGRRGKSEVTLQGLLLPPEAGRQTVLCAETREACTTLLRGIASDLAAEAKGGPDPVVLLIDPSPEELAEWRRDAPQAEIVAAGQPRHAADALAQASTRAGRGDDVILLVDSLTRLAEAYEDAEAAKEFFDAGRVQGSAGGGSLTVVAALERS
jgi:hypothetical protein